MFRRFLSCLAIIAAAAVAAAAFQWQAGFIRTARPADVPSGAPARLTVVVVPLDSRPPCTQYVQQLAGLGGIRAILPPPELLDRYRTPADRAALREWLRSAAPLADAAIVSTDMLMHGGLMASRKNAGTAADGDAVLAVLAELHRDHPRLRIYAFSIIPRLLLADDSDERYQKKMFAFSVLKDEVLTFENPLDREKLDRLAAQIPAAVVGRYQALYEANAQFNHRLMAMVEQGALAGLVIGQDDGFPFGLPNMVKSRLTHFVAHRPELAGRVVVTRGTDEVALMLLGRLAAEATGFEPRVYVQYSHAAAPGKVMPYMPHSVARTVAEKIALAGGREVGDPGQADFVLFVHIGTAGTGPGKLAAAAREVKGLMAAGHRVAVVDLSEYFFAAETILPYMLKEGADVTRLAAYAGWNTTSNSVGTAITQAAIFTGALARSGGGEAPLGLYRHQLTFLTARLLDDWYYQKDVQPYVNGRLKAFHVDPYNLGGQLERVDAWIGGLLSDRAAALYRAALAGRPLPVQDADGKRYIVSGLTVESRLPWQRTFEVWLQPRLEFAVLEE
jgi:hypothetical protein